MEWQMFKLSQVQVRQETCYLANDVRSLEAKEFNIKLLESFVNFSLQNIKESCELTEGSSLTMSKISGDNKQSRKSDDGWL